MPQAAIYLPSLPKFMDEEEDVIPSLWRGGVSEFFATLIFVFIGTGSVVASKTNLGTNTLDTAALVLISLAHGFAIMVLVYAIGEVSGGHINPAVTWSILLTNKISLVRALVYMIAQLCGAVAGSGILSSLLPPPLQFHLGCHSVNTSLTPAQGFGCEVVFTFIFIFIVFATAVSPFAGKLTPLSGSEYGPGKLAPFAVGMAILMLHTVGIPLTGASMNPARSFGPALVRNLDVCWAHHWVYWVGPFVGSSAAAIIAQIIFLNSPDTLARSFKVSRGGVALNEPISPAPQSSTAAPAPTITTQTSSSTSSVARVSYEKPQPLSNVEIHHEQIPLEENI